MNIEQLVTFLNEQRELAAPAPWKVLELYSDGVTVVDVNGFEHVEIPNVAIVPDWEKLGLEHWSDNGGSRDVSLEEQRANGYLAAAAPQLLAYVNVLNRNLETTENALRRMLKMHALMMAKPIMLPASMMLNVFTKWPRLRMRPPRFLSTSVAPMPRILT